MAYINDSAFDAGLAYLEIESNIGGIITTYGQEEISITASPVITE